MADPQPIGDVLAELGPDLVPALMAVVRLYRSQLLTTVELASRWKVQPAMIQKLVKRGMPRHLVGSVPRYDYLECLQWLDRQQAPKQPPGPLPDRPIPGVERAPRRLRKVHG